MARVEGQGPLQEIVAAFEPLADMATRGVAMEVRPFADACEKVSAVFDFEYVRNDFVAYVKKEDLDNKVADLKTASESITTLKNMIELDIQQGCVTTEGSHTRNLLRINRVLIMIRVICEDIMNSHNGNDMSKAASAAYNKVFGSHHDDGIKRATENAISLLPSMSEFLTKMNVDEQAIQSFIRTSGPVIQYVEDLFKSKQLDTDW